ncbi:SpoIIE family protein phosphatase [Magnetospira sp. QH-2]|uniref:SpoIIE family protein phosphatase n=1 Tax=Magnetospira sp. (strain QH-2) TaxID=1288970 RepID=UPI00130EAA8C|nr:SpoIIE family protein phosphatase [Magnetospira sp. QH-2]
MNEESRRRGVAFYLRAGLLGLSILSIATLLVALFFFSRMSGNLSQISQTTLPVLALSQDLTRQTKSIESTARRIANLRQPFELQSLSFQLSGDLDQLTQTVANLDKAGIDATRRTRMTHLIGEIRQTVERLDSLVAQVINAEARFRRYSASLVTLAQRATGLDAYLENESILTLEQRRRVTEKLYGTLEHAFVSLSTTVPEEIIQSKVGFLFSASEFEILLKELNLTLSSAVWEIPELLKSVNGMFIDRLSLMRVQMRVRGAAKRLVIIEKMIALSTEISHELSAEAEAQAQAMQDRAGNLTQVIALVALLSLVLAIAINLFINRRIVRRMKRLQQSMLARVDGSEAAIDTSGADEITDMANSFKFFVEEVKAREASLQVRTTELQGAYDVIADSIQYASRIQRSILPNTEILNDWFRDHFVLWEPRDVVSGDVYWCEPWGEGLLVMLADCTGHGVPGAFVTLVATGALERAKLEVPEGDASLLIQRMNQFVQQTLGQVEHSGESDDGLELGACYITPGGKDLHFVGARFDLFVCKDGTMDVVRGMKQGIGYRGVQSDQTYDSHVISLKQGTEVFLISDGFFDQVGGERRRGFGKKRLVALLEAQHGQPSVDQKERLYKMFLDYQGAEVRRDDISIIGLRC